MEHLIIVRGGGDLATGTIYKLKKSGFPVLILETRYPSAIRRNVSFCEAVYQGSQTVEDLTCHRAETLEQAREFLNKGKLTVLVDPAGEAIKELKPLAVVDAILAKKNLGTSRELAPITVALGPGFTAGVAVRGKISRAMEDILYDPQTSGGLLFALPADQADACLAHLRHTIPDAAIIGYVTEKEDAYIILE